MLREIDDKEMKLANVGRMLEETEKNFRDEPLLARPPPEEVDSLAA